MISILIIFLICFDSCRSFFLGQPEIHFDYKLCKLSNIEHSENKKHISCPDTVKNLPFSIVPPSGFAINNRLIPINDFFVFMDLTSVNIKEYNVCNISNDSCNTFYLSFGSLATLPTLASIMVEDAFSKITQLNPDILIYKVKVPAAQTSPITVTGAGRTLVSFESFEEAKSTQASSVIAPQEMSGVPEISIFAVAEFSGAKSTFKIQYRAVGTNAALSDILFAEAGGLPCNGCAMSPSTFDPTQLFYYFTMPYDRKRTIIEITALARTPSLISIDGSTPVNSTAVTAAFGFTPNVLRDELVITVETEKGMRVYHVMVDWARLHNDPKLIQGALLTSIRIFNGIIHEEFNPLRLSYSAVIDSETPRIAFRVVVANPKSKVFLDGAKMRYFEIQPIPPNNVTLRDSLESIARMPETRTPEEIEAARKLHILQHPFSSSSWGASRTRVSDMQSISRGSTRMFFLRIVQPNTNLAVEYTVSVHRAGKWFASSSFVSLFGIVSVILNLGATIINPFAWVESAAFMQFVDGVASVPGLPEPFVEYVSYFEVATLAYWMKKAMEALGWSSTPKKVDEFIDDVADDTGSPSFSDWSSSSLSENEGGGKDMISSATIASIHGEESKIDFDRNSVLAIQPQGSTFQQQSQDAIRAFRDSAVDTISKLDGTAAIVAAEAGGGSVLKGGEVSANPLLFTGGDLIHLASKFQAFIQNGREEEGNVIRSTKSFSGGTNSDFVNEAKILRRLGFQQEFDDDFSVEAAIERYLNYESGNSKNNRNFDEGDDAITLNNDNDEIDLNDSAINDYFLSLNSLDNNYNNLGEDEDEEVERNIWLDEYNKAYRYDHKKELDNTRKTALKNIVEQIPGPFQETVLKSENFSEKISNWMEESFSKPVKNFTDSSYQMAQNSVKDFLKSCFDSIPWISKWIESKNADFPRLSQQQHSVNSSIPSEYTNFQEAIRMKLESMDNTPSSSSLDKSSFSPLNPLYWSRQFPWRDGKYLVEQQQDKKPIRMRQTVKDRELYVIGSKLNAYGRLIRVLKFNPVPTAFQTPDVVQAIKYYKARCSILDGSRSEVHRALKFHEDNNWRIVQWTKNKYSKIPRDSLSKFANWLGVANTTVPPPNIPSSRPTNLTAIVRSNSMDDVKKEDLESRLFQYASIRKLSSTISHVYEHLAKQAVEKLNTSEYDYICRLCIEFTSQVTHLTKNEIENRMTCNLIDGLVDMLEATDNVEGEIAEIEDSTAGLILDEILSLGKLAYPTPLLCRSAMIANLSSTQQVDAHNNNDNITITTKRMLMEVRLTEKPKDMLVLESHNFSKSVKAEHLIKLATSAILPIYIHDENRKRDRPLTPWQYFAILQDLRMKWRRFQSKLDSRPFMTSFVPPMFVGESIDTLNDEYNSPRINWFIPRIKRGYGAEILENVPDLYGSSSGASIASSFFYNPLEMVAMDKDREDLAALDKTIAKGHTLSDHVISFDFIKTTFRSFFSDIFKFSSNNGFNNKNETALSNLKKAIRDDQDPFHLYDIFENAEKRAARRAAELKRQGKELRKKSESLILLFISLIAILAVYFFLVLPRLQAPSKENTPNQNSDSAETISHHPAIPVDEGTIRVGPSILQPLPFCLFLLDSQLVASAKYAFDLLCAPSAIVQVKLFKLIECPYILMRIFASITLIYPTFFLIYTFIKLMEYNHAFTFSNLLYLYIGRTTKLLKGYQAILGSKAAEVRSLVYITPASTYASSADFASKIPDSQRSKESDYRLLDPRMFSRRDITLINFTPLKGRPEMSAKHALSAKKLEIIVTAILKKNINLISPQPTDVNDHISNIIYRYRNDSSDWMDNKTCNNRKINNLTIHKNQMINSSDKINRSDSIKAKNQSRLSAFLTLLKDKIPNVIFSEKQIPLNPENLIQLYVELYVLSGDHNTDENVHFEKNDPADSKTIVKSFDYKPEISNESSELENNYMSKNCSDLNNNRGIIFDEDIGSADSNEKMIFSEELFNKTLNHDKKNISNNPNYNSASKNALSNQPPHYHLPKDKGHDSINNDDIESQSLIKTMSKCDSSPSETIICVRGISLLPLHASLLLFSFTPLPPSSSSSNLSNYHNPDEIENGILDDMLEGSFNRLPGPSCLIDSSSGNLTSKAEKSLRFDTYQRDSHKSAFCSANENSLKPQNREEEEELDTLDVIVPDEDSSTIQNTNNLLSAQDIRSLIKPVDVFDIAELGWNFTVEELLCHLALRENYNIATGSSESITFDSNSEEIFVRLDAVRTCMQPLVHPINDQKCPVDSNEKNIKFSSQSIISSQQSTDNPVLDNIVQKEISNVTVRSKSLLETNKGLLRACSHFILGHIRASILNSGLELILLRIQIHAGALKPLLDTVKTPAIWTPIYNIQQKYDALQPVVGGRTAGGQFFFYTLNRLFMLLLLLQSSYFGSAYLDAVVRTFFVMSLLEFTLQLSAESAYAIFKGRNRSVSVSVMLPNESSTSVNEPKIEKGNLSKSNTSSEENLPHKSISIGCLVQFPLKIRGDDVMGVPASFRHCCTDSKNLDGIPPLIQTYFDGLNALAALCAEEDESLRRAKVAEEKFLNETLASKGVKLTQSARQNSSLRRVNSICDPHTYTFSRRASSWLSHNHKSNAGGESRRALYHDKHFSFDSTADIHQQSKKKHILAQSPSAEIFSFTPKGETSTLQNKNERSIKKVPSLLPFSPDDLTNVEISNDMYNDNSNNNILNNDDADGNSRGNLNDAHLWSGLRRKSVLNELITPMMLKFDALADVDPIEIGNSIPKRGRFSTPHNRSLSQPVNGYYENASPTSDSETMNKRKALSPNRSTSSFKNLIPNPLFATELGIHKSSDHSGVLQTSNSFNILPSNSGVNFKGNVVMDTSCANDTVLANFLNDGSSVSYSNKDINSYRRCQQQHTQDVQMSQNSTFIPYGVLSPASSSSHSFLSTRGPGYMKKIKFNPSALIRFDSPKSKKVQIEDHKELNLSSNEANALNGMESPVLKRRISNHQSTVTFLDSDVFDDGEILFPFVSSTGDFKLLLPRDALSCSTSTFQTINTPINHSFQTLKLDRNPQRLRERSIAVLPSTGRVLQSFHDSDGFPLLLVELTHPLNSAPALSINFKRPTIHVVISENSAVVVGMEREISRQADAKEGLFESNSVAVGSSRLNYYHPVMEFFFENPTGMKMLLVFFFILMMITVDGDIRLLSVEAGSFSMMLVTFTMLVVMNGVQLAKIYTRVTELLLHHTVLIGHRWVTFVQRLHQSIHALELPSSDVALVRFHARDIGVAFDGSVDIARTAFLIEGNKPSSLEHMTKTVSTADLSDFTKNPDHAYAILPSKHVDNLSIFPRDRFSLLDSYREVPTLERRVLMVQVPRHVRALFSLFSSSQQKNMSCLFDSLASHRLANLPFSLSSIDLFGSYSHRRRPHNFSSKQVAETAGLLNTYNPLKGSAQSGSSLSHFASTPILVLHVAPNDLTLPRFLPSDPTIELPRYQEAYRDLCMRGSNDIVGTFNSNPLFAPSPGTLTFDVPESAKHGGAFDYAAATVPCITSPTNILILLNIPTVIHCFREKKKSRNCNSCQVGALFACLECGDIPDIAWTSFNQSPNINNTHKNYTSDPYSPSAVRLASHSPIRSIVKNIPITSPSAVLMNLSGMAAISSIDLASNRFSNQDDNEDSPVVNTRQNCFNRTPPVVSVSGFNDDCISDIESWQVDLLSNPISISLQIGNDDSAPIFQVDSATSHDGRLAFSGNGQEGDCLLSLLAANFAHLHRNNKHVHDMTATAVAGLESVLFDKISPHCIILIQKFLDLDDAAEVINWNSGWIKGGPFEFFINYRKIILEVLRRANSFWGQIHCYSNGNYGDWQIILKSSSEHVIQIVKLPIHPDCLDNNLSHCLENHASTSVEDEVIEQFSNTLKVPMQVLISTFEVPSGNLMEEDNKRSSSISSSSIMRSIKNLVLIIMSDFYHFHESIWASIKSNFRVSNSSLIHFGKKVFRNPFPMNYPVESFISSKSHEKFPKSPSPYWIIAEDPLFPVAIPCECIFRRRLPAWKSILPLFQVSPSAPPFFSAPTVFALAADSIDDLDVQMRFGWMQFTLETCRKLIFSAILSHSVAKMDKSKALLDSMDSLLDQMLSRDEMEHIELARHSQSLFRLEELRLILESTDSQPTDDFDNFNSFENPSNLNTNSNNNNSVIDMLDEDAEEFEIYLDRIDSTFISRAWKALKSALKRKKAKKSRRRIESRLINSSLEFNKKETFVKNYVSFIRKFAEHPPKKIDIKLDNYSDKNNNNLNIPPKIDIQTLIHFFAFAFIETQTYDHFRTLGINHFHFDDPSVFKIQLSQLYESSHTSVTAPTISHFVLLSKTSSLISFIKLFIHKTVLIMNLIKEQIERILVDLGFSYATAARIIRLDFVGGSRKLRRQLGFEASYEPINREDTHDVEIPRHYFDQSHTTSMPKEKSKITYLFPSDTGSLYKNDTSETPKHNDSPKSIHHSFHPVSKSSHKIFKGMGFDCPLSWLSPAVGVLCLELISLELRFELAKKRHFVEEERKKKMEKEENETKKEEISKPGNRHHATQTTWDIVKDQLEVIDVLLTRAELSDPSLKSSLSNRMNDLNQNEPSFFPSKKKDNYGSLYSSFVNGIELGSISRSFNRFSPNKHGQVFNDESDNFSAYNLTNDKVNEFFLDIQMVICYINMALLTGDFTDAVKIEWIQILESHTTAYDVETLRTFLNKRMISVNARRPLSLKIEQIQLTSVRRRGHNQQQILEIAPKIRKFLLDDVGCEPNEIFVNPKDISRVLGTADESTTYADGLIAQIPPLFKPRHIFPEAANFLHFRGSHPYHVDIVEKMILSELRFTLSSRLSRKNRPLLHFISPVSAIRSSNSVRKPSPVPSVCVRIVLAPVIQRCTNCLKRINPSVQVEQMVQVMGNHGTLPEDYLVEIDELQKMANMVLSYYDFVENLNTGSDVLSRKAPNTDGEDPNVNNTIENSRYLADTDLNLTMNLNLSPSKSTGRNKDKELRSPLKKKRKSRHYNNKKIQNSIPELTNNIFCTCYDIGPEANPFTNTLYAASPDSHALTYAQRFIPSDNSFSLNPDASKLLSVTSPHGFNSRSINPYSSSNETHLDATQSRLISNLVADSTSKVISNSGGSPLSIPVIPTLLSNGEYFRQISHDSNGILDVASLYYNRPSDIHTSNQNYNVPIGVSKPLFPAGIGGSGILRPSTTKITNVQALTSPSFLNEISAGIKGCFVPWIQSRIKRKTKNVNLVDNDANNSNNEVINNYDNSNNKKVININSDLESLSSSSRSTPKSISSSFNWSSQAPHNVPYLPPHIQPNDCPTLPPFLFSSPGAQNEMVKSHEDSPKMEFEQKLNENVTDNNPAKMEEPTSACHMEVCGGCLRFFFFRHDVNLPMNTPPSQMVIARQIKFSSIARIDIDDAEKRFIFHVIPNLASFPEQQKHVIVSPDRSPIEQCHKKKYTSLKVNNSRPATDSSISPRAFRQTATNNKTDNSQIRKQSKHSNGIQLPKHLIQKLRILASIQIFNVETGIAEDIPQIEWQPNADKIRDILRNSLLDLDRSCAGNKWLAQNGKFQLALRLGEVLGELRGFLEIHLEDEDVFMLLKDVFITAGLTDDIIINREHFNHS